MAMGIPVIANSGVGDVKEIIEKYEAGFVVDHFTEDEMGKIIDKAIDPQTKFNPHTIREGAKDFYNLEKTVNTYKQVYKKILG
jgi:glycosyltransferase involved in cell wall biosynthesis